MKTRMLKPAYWEWFDAFKAARVLATVSGRRHRVEQFPCHRLGPIWTVTEVGS